jgi:hypothetical protein
MSCVFAVVALTQPAQNFDKETEKEIALGRQLAAEYRQKVQVVESAAVTAYVSGIGRRLTRGIGGPPLPYTFAVTLDDPAIMHEAAAFPGGLVFVPAALILEAKDEDELAGMLKRSIAKIASRESRKSAGTASHQNAAGAALIFLGGWTGYAFAQGSPPLPLGLYGWWRNLEINADRVAARSMAAAGWDPAALARYVERLQTPDNGATKLSPLPSGSERLQAIELCNQGTGTSQLWSARISRRNPARTCALDRGHQDTTHSGPVAVGQPFTWKVALLVLSRERPLRSHQHLQDSSGSLPSGGPSQDRLPSASPPRIEA